MGGMVVRRMPLEQPERIDALVLMDTSAARLPVLIPELVEAAAEIGFTQGKDVLREMLVAAGTLDTPPYKRMLAERPGYAEFDARKWADTSMEAWGTLAIEIANQDDDLPLLREVRCRTLVIVGEQDEPFLDASRAMAAAIPGAQLAVIAGGGHSPQFEAPAAWIAALDGFLAGLPAPVA
jgi:pimeloyl-ACP methyl ester carboxylesterase